MSGISTHILDIAKGKPATGVQVQLERFGEGNSMFGGLVGLLWKQVAEGTTDADGRCNPVLAPAEVHPGIYRLTFVTGPYFKALELRTLYPEVTITFSVAPGEQNYHIPLLLSPFGYSTYRGADMAILQENHYGKSRVRLMKVTRHTAGQHDVHEWSVGLYLSGPFTTVFTEGDNTGITATDTMKNMVYAVARTSTAATLEGFAIELAQFLSGRQAELTQVRVTVEEKLWMRVKADTPSGKREFHGSAFLQRGPDVATTSVIVKPGTPPVVTAAWRGLVILKTAHSGFSGFTRDQYTTLPETDDRLLGTEATIEWPYAIAPSDYAATRRSIMDTLLTTFANHESLSVQHTLYAMAEAALAATPEIDEMSLTMPNRHNIPVNLKSFDLDNPNTIFVPTDEPHGHIFARVVRG